MEPHTNGPLFVEVAFYLQAAKLTDLQEFKAERLIPASRHLGVPHFVASGSLTYCEKKYRFLVLPRYGTDLQTILDDENQVIEPAKACDMAIQVVIKVAHKVIRKAYNTSFFHQIDSLEYIHSRGYIHKDIKGSNLLTSRIDSSRVYLVDFGLCSKYVRSGLHKPYQPDRRWAHEGTVEYTSRDCHLGCFSRRGDVEVLFYNLIEWFGGKLPWDDMGDSVRPSVIQNMKVDAFTNPHTFLRTCFEGKEGGGGGGDAAFGYPKVLLDFMARISGYAFEQQPDYEDLKRLLRQEAADREAESEVVLKMEMVPAETAASNGDKENVDPEQTRESTNGANGDSVDGKFRLKPAPDDSLSPSAFMEDAPGSHVALEEYKELLRARIKRECELSLKNPTPAMLELLESQKAKSTGSRTPGGGKGRRGRRQGANA